MPQSIQVKSILNKTKRRDPWFLDDYTLNPYSGCSFNCQFCYIRGSRYGEHMEEKTSVKVNALELLEKQLYLRAKKDQYGIIVLSSATDPYLHFEEKEKLTRAMLELILKYRFPVHVITRSDLVIRDIELLKEIESAAILPLDLRENLKRKVFVTFSFSHLDDQFTEIFEPGATAASKRLLAFGEVVSQNLFSGISLMPLLPYISDTGENLEKMFALFAEKKANYIFPASVTLFGTSNSDNRTLVFRAIEKHYPDLLPKYERLFASSNSVSEYYASALKKKTEELALKYQIPMRII